MSQTPIRAHRPMTPAERNLRMKIEKNKATEIRLLKEMSRPKILIGKVPEHTKPTRYYLELAKQRYQNLQESKSSQSLSKSPSTLQTTSRTKLPICHKPDLKSCNDSRIEDSIPDWLQSRVDFQETVKALKKNEEQRIPEILEINYHSRTQEDKKLLISYLQTINFFKALPLEVVSETANRLIKEEFKENEKIIRKGDLADGLVLIYTGSASVVIEGILVAVKNPGDVVGENALDYRAPRSADVVANSACTILKLMRDDYEAAILSTKRQEKQEIFELLKSMLLFQSWSTLKLMRLSAAINVKTVDAGVSVYKRNDPCTSLFFVKEGKIDVYSYVPIEQSNKWPVSVYEWKIHQVNREYLVKIAKVKAGEYFGELEIVKDCKRVLKAVAKTRCVLLELNKDHVFGYFNESEMEVLKSFSFTKVPDLRDLQEKVLREIDLKSSCENALMDALKANVSNQQGRDFFFSSKVKKMNNWLLDYKSRKVKSAKDLNNKIVFENSRNISVQKFRKKKRL